MTTATAPTHAEQAYIHAEKAINHYQRILAGDGLTDADRYFFRCLLIRAVFARCAAARLVEGR